MLSDPSKALFDACAKITAKDMDGAASIIRERYPFIPYTNAGRNYTPYQSLQIFLQDGFLDRYSGQKLVNPAALRLLSALLPNEFPAHRNWKQSESHIAFWELFPTIDHVIPVARGGKDHSDNWVTTSMLRNSAKSNSMLDEIGWSLHPAGQLDSWDGLTNWAIEYVDGTADLESLTEEASRHKTYVQKWVRASKRALAAV